jgi:hypothetical protein
MKNSSEKRQEWKETNLNFDTLHIYVITFNNTKKKPSLLNLTERDGHTKPVHYYKPVGYR